MSGMLLSKSNSKLHREQSPEPQYYLRKNTTLLWEKLPPVHFHQKMK